MNSDNQALPRKEDARGVEITHYTDYVPFVTDLVQYKRGATGFSYRVFCRKSGFKSPAYLKWVIDRTRPISSRSVHKFAAGLSLDRREAQYFTLLVNFKEAAHPQTKHYYYEQILKWQQHRAGPFTKDAYEYLSHWYYVAIRELIASPDFRDDLRWIRDRLGGHLTLWEIKSGLETLERLKLIRRDATGRWQQASRDLHTEHEIRSLAAFNYHTEMLERAQQVLVERPAGERDYQSLVALADEEDLKTLKTKIQQFWNEMVEYLQQKERSNSEPHGTEELYALNLQLLPLSARSRKEDL